MSDRTKHNSDSPAPASRKTVPKSPQRRRYCSFKCPHCHRTIHRWFVPAEAQDNPKPKGRIGRAPKKAPLFVDALLRHVNGQSWSEIAKRLDPKGFKENPAAARERFRKGAHHYESTLLGWILVPEPPGKN